MVSGEIDRQLDELETACGLARTAALRVDVAHCDVAQLGRFRSLTSGMRNTIDASDADAARRAAELRGGGTSRPVDDAMNPGGRSSPGTERADKDRRGVFDAIPGFEDATRSGVLSGVYSDIVAKAVKRLDREVRAEFYRRHQHLAQLAGDMSEHAFRRYVKQRVEVVLHDCGVERGERQRRNRKASLGENLDDGMIRLGCEFDPDTGAQITNAIETEINAIFHTRRDDPTDLRSREQIMADAVAGLLCGTAISGKSRNGGHTVLVLTDQPTATGGLHDQSVHEYGNGTPVAPGTLQRIVQDPDTEVRTATVNEHGVVIAIGDATLDEGRGQRFATPVQRLALRAMYRTCMIPGCTMPFTSCEIHHLLDWDQGGMTDLENLGPLCSYHHHLAHREHWNIRVDPTTRQLTITHPNGHTETHPYTGLTPPNTEPATQEAGPGMHQPTPPTGREPPLARQPPLDRHSSEHEDKDTIGATRDPESEVPCHEAA